MFSEIRKIENQKKLKSMRNELEFYYLNPNNNSQNYRNIISNDFIIRETIKKYSLNNDNIVYSKFINWILNNQNFFIKNNPLKDLFFTLLYKDFTLMADISLSLNRNSNIPIYKDTQLLLELYFLTSVKSGLYVGIKFINELISLSNTLNIPLILYCEDNLIPYYQRLGFIKTNIFDDLKNALMIYQ